MSIAGYDSSLNDLIESIKKKLARQYLKNKNITVGKAFQNIERRLGKSDSIILAVEKLRLKENTSMRVDEYLSKNTLKKYTGLMYL